MMTTQDIPFVVTGAVREAFGVALNALGKSAGLPPLDWTYQPVFRKRSGITGHASRGNYATEDIPDVLCAWSTFLNLTHNTKVRVTSIREYTGTVDGLPFSVWGVIDDESFDTGHDTSKGC